MGDIELDRALADEADRSVEQALAEESTYDAETPEDIEEAALRAEARGFKVYRGSPNLLLLDFDTPEALAGYLRLKPLIAEKFGIAHEEMWSSKSVGHTHVALTIRRSLPVLLRVALQAALGSDPVREILAATASFVDGKDSEVSLLFRPK